MLEQLISLDKKLMIFFNKTISNSFFDIIMPIITNQNFLASIALVLILYLVIYSGIKGRITILILIVAAGFSDAICAQIIKPWVGRIRPSYEFIDFINLLVSKGGKWSFPSNHAANSFAFATTLSYFYKKYKKPLYISACAIAFSRVYVGVHYPIDIIAGSLFGYTITWIVLSIWTFIKIQGMKRKKVWALKV